MTEPANTAQVQGPQPPTWAEHDQLHGGTGDPNSAQGANYVLDLDPAWPRARCYPCGLPVLLEGMPR